MRRPLGIPACCAAVVAGILGAGVAGAGAHPDPGRDVAKTTIPTAPTGPVPTAPVPTVPAPTASPTVPLPTASPTVPLPTASPTTPLPTAPLPTVPVTTPGVPTTEAAGLSPESLAAALPIFGLDMTKLQCVDAALPPLSADDNQAVAALQSCGVALMPLLRGMVAVFQGSTSFLDPTVTTVALPPVPGIEALPSEDAFFLGFMMLIDTTQASCLATGLAGATAEDDATALAIFQRCEVSIAFTLDMLTFGLVGDFTVDPTATTVPGVTVPGATIPVPTAPVATAPVASGVPTTLSIAPDDPLVDEFQAVLLEEQGITLDDAQAACLLSHIGTGGEIDTQDTAALIELLDSCGVTLSDLVPGGSSA